MDYSLENFVKKHDKVICIDSDGTMIDAMNVKHRRCHGASFIDLWQLNDKADEVQKVWDGINLFEKSRGVNRFIALEEMLRRCEKRGWIKLDPDDFKVYCDWVAKGKISNKDLVAEMEHNDSPLLKKAYDWSVELNRRIESVTSADKPPYEGAREALEYAKGKCDIAIISSSNMAAIVKEWSDHDLLKYVDVITSQEIGSKNACIARMLTKGYGKEDVLMMGDAYPDVDASAENCVWYYPILTRHEKESWDDFHYKYFDLFLEGRYDECQQELMDRFENNFDKNA